MTRHAQHHVQIHPGRDGSLQHKQPRLSFLTALPQKTKVPPKTLPNSQYCIPLYLRNHRFYHGRRYPAFHKGLYICRNDEQERKRGDLKHAIIVNLCAGRLHLLQLLIIRSRWWTWEQGQGFGIWIVRRSLSALF